MSILLVVDDDEEQLRLQTIEEKRNKSRLHDSHRNIVHSTLPFTDASMEFHKTVKYQRKMFGIYGKESGVNPGICWPTKQEIAERKEYEKIAFPQTIQEMMASAAEQRKTLEENQRKRQEDVVKKHAKLEQWKNDLKQKIAKKEADALAVKQRKDRLVEEVRRHFGYKIDPRDERFKEMLEQKERAEKKAMKEAKRKVKEAKLVAKLQEGKTSNKTNETENTTETVEKTEK